MFESIGFVTSFSRCILVDLFTGFFSASRINCDFNLNYFSDFFVIFFEFLMLFVRDLGYYFGSWLKLKILWPQENFIIIHWRRWRRGENVTVTSSLWSFHKFAGAAACENVATREGQVNMLSLSGIISRISAASIEARRRARAAEFEKGLFYLKSKAWYNRLTISVLV